MDFTQARQNMVKRQIAGRGIRSPLLLDAMGKVPREAFVAKTFRKCAYDDGPLPIAAGQTISQPYTVASMIESLNLVGGEKVLEIGSGSGYAAAILAEMATNVFAIDRLHVMVETAKATLEKLGYDQVRFKHADGTCGWPEQAPFDAILVSAGGPKIPESLKSQLRIGGRLIIPVGGRLSQQLLRVTRRSETEFDIEEVAGVRFVLLLGKEGWQTDGKTTKV
jgi:protein-L-isoaspartate(D-aspartate) O-methyltransferase